MYCDADRFEEYNFLNKNNAEMKFKINLIEYEVNHSWIQPVLEDINQTIKLSERPAHNEFCEYGKFLKDSTCH